MTLKKLTILMLALLLPLSMSAQKKKKRVVKKQPVIEEPQEDPRITNMREMTQQIVIIDSIVTDKDQFLAQLRLSSETGRLVSSQEFFGRTDSTCVFINEMGNKIYFSQPVYGAQQLYTSDKLGDEWSQPLLLKGINEGISEAAYPFMLTDGTTFYFAGKGDESIGGYDIFMTRYNSHTGRFLNPENIGMPFNSEANDYMYAIDEFNRIGYFVSDRRQPEGKVCVYIFIPSERRKTYDSSVYTEQQIRDLADITCIADTWGNGTERKAALERMRTINNVRPSAELKTNTSTVPFVINEALSYSSAKDFLNPKAAHLYREYLDAQGRLAQYESELEKARDLFPKASAADRRSLRQEILQMEEESQKLYQQISSLEKEIRQEENKLIT